MFNVSVRVTCMLVFVRCVRRELAQNPLLLSIIAMVYLNCGFLPAERYELYQLAVRHLIDVWCANPAALATSSPSSSPAPSPSPSPPPYSTASSSPSLSREELEYVLPSLAHFMHDNYSSGLIPGLAVSLIAVLCLTEPMYSCATILCSVVLSHLVFVNVHMWSHSFTNLAPFFPIENSLKQHLLKRLLDRSQQTAADDTSELRHSLEKKVDKFIAIMRATFGVSAVICGRISSSLCL